MLNQKSFPECTSSNFEKIAIKRFRALALCIPRECKVFREPWGCSTVLCLDFQACPTQLEAIQKQAHMVVIAAQHLSLADSVNFKLGNKVMGWTRVTNPQ